ncbi:MAG: hypothetical protein JRG75_07135 [Deltaproteobacteria bacterium]|nr:hypothetical protein [Deltaproteobacteria bacterium]
MYKLLLVATDKNSLSDLASALLTHGDVDLSWADSGSTALNMISTTPVDLLVTEETLADMSGLELANKLLHVNPMINCAAVSPLRGWGCWLSCPFSQVRNSQNGCYRFLAS